MAKARLALIGCGPRGLRGHAPGLSRTEEIELVAVCDLVEDRFEEVTERGERQLRLRLGARAGQYEVSVLPGLVEFLRGSVFVAHKTLEVKL